MGMLPHIRIFKK